MDEERAAAPRVLDDPGADLGRPASAPRAVAGVRRRRFSLGATFLGWAVASFFTLVFTGIVLLALGGSALRTDDGTLTAGDLANLTITGLAGAVVAMFLAYLVGGYAAGRIAHWDGARHGAVVPLWTILAGLLALLAGATLGPQLAGYLGPYVPRVDAGALTTYGVLGLLAMLAADFLGAILGGILGAKGDERHEMGTVERRRTMRGRPL
jgi:MFS family permease